MHDVLVALRRWNRLPGHSAASTAAAIALPQKIRRVPAGVIDALVGGCVIYDVALTAEQWNAAAEACFALSAHLAFNPIDASDPADEFGSFRLYTLGTRLLEAL